MAPLLATACIVFMVAALSIYGPSARPRQPAHMRSRERRWAHGVLTALWIGLAVGAVAIIGFPLYTNLQQDRIQSRLERQIVTPELKHAYVERDLDVGDSLTRLLIPAIDVDVVVVEGTTAGALQAGAGHYASTPLPCEVGNVAIAGHRTTYGRPFHNVDLLKVGDQITLETPIGPCTYEVTQEPFAVPPTQVDVVANTPGEATLTLTTCHPKGSDRLRLIIKAKLVSSGIDASTGSAT